MIIDAPAHGRIRELRALWTEAFGDEDDFLDPFFETAFSAQRCRCVIENGVLNAALYWFDASFDGKRIAYLYAVAVAATVRGRGIGSALLENTHRHLRSGGYAGAVLVPVGAALFPYYERFGYRPCSSVSEFECEAGAAAETLQPIGIDEYARLRRQYLPTGGVLQEGISLRFLSEQADLFAGSGFLLALARGESIPFGTELLGRPDAAPGILRALQAPRGKFRTPGDGRPFAMYRPLDGTDDAPRYFGLAFD